MRPYLLAETNLHTIRQHQFEVALLPWGATEAHNLHLPFGTDAYESDFFSAEAGRLAWEKGVKCLILPSMPFGVNTGQMDIPGTINIYPSTQAQIINDVLESLETSGIRKFIILNSHGGNDFKQILREAGSSFPDILLVTANWYQALDRNEFFEHDGDHADEMETSLMLHLKPELVLPLDKAGDGKSKSFTSDALNEKWTWSERKWSKITEDTGIGYPKMATAKKGKAYFEAVSTKIAGLIMEIAKVDPVNPYK
ncbi:creatininase family protein [Bacteroidota bacterium]